MHLKQLFIYLFIFSSLQAIDTQKSRWVPIVFNDFTFFIQYKGNVLTISDVKVSEITTSSAKVSWSLNDYGTGQVEYGETTNYGLFNIKETSFKYNTLTLNNLKSNTTYHYRIISEDKKGNKVVSKDATFITLSLPLISISDVSINKITANTVEVSWSLDDYGTGQVEYGETTEYSYFSKKDSFSPQHIQTLKNLHSDTIYHYRIISKDEVGNRVVSNDKTFKTLKSKSSILYKEEIHEAFDTHYAYFTKQIRKRMKKDTDGCGSNTDAVKEGGCSDTYVLYDVQTYMQNAIIYADEQSDTEMIEKLLTLVLIPFEERYISKDGLWLNNKDEVPRYRKLWGVEVELPLTQYFSLLTRVLSTAQRHNVPTSITQREIKIMIDHIDKWINTIPLPPKYTKLSDVHMFKIQSALQFADYASQSGIEIEDLDKWKRMVQDYIKLQIEPKWEKVDCKDENGNGVDNCLALWRRDTPTNSSYAYSGYGLELTKTSSDTDPNAMFDADGWVKHPPKRANKVGADVSHGRRFNWFFETVNRFGTPFEVSIPEEKLQGWANNLAYRVSRGTEKDPKFTIFSDGVDGWYRVNYNGGKGPRPGFGYTSGDMDIHFVASSYGMLGVYNPKIYTWMKAWAEKHESKMNGYEGAYLLDYYTSMVMDMRKNLW